MWVRVHRYVVWWCFLSLCNVDKYTKPHPHDHDDACLVVLVRYYSTCTHHDEKRGGKRNPTGERIPLWVSLLPSHHHLPQKIKKSKPPFYGLFFFSLQSSKNKEIKMDRSVVKVRRYTHATWWMDILSCSFAGKLQCYMFNIIWQWRFLSFAIRIYLLPSIPSIKLFVYTGDTRVDQTRDPFT